MALDRDYSSHPTSGVGELEEPEAPTRSLPFPLLPFPPLLSVPSPLPPLTFRRSMSLKSS